MQISRHWRMNAQRYRLEGFRYQNGEVSLQRRLTLPGQEAPNKSPESSVVVQMSETVSHPSGERKG